MTDKALERQRQFLVDAINDAKTAELNRLKKIDRIKDLGLREKQLQRYDVERAHDQQRIENLSNDYTMLQQKVASGELQAAKDFRRTHRDAHTAQGFQELHNRFAGFETRDKMLFFTDVCNKFDHYDKREERRANTHVFDAYAEQKKLKLLNQKKDILQRLIHTQAVEAQAAGTTQQGGIGGQARRGRPADTRSVSSGESWATFASSRGSGAPTRPRLRMFPS